jgi:hypothetical protein
VPDADSGKDVVVEGTATRETDAEALQELTGAWVEEAVRAADYC